MFSSNTIILGEFNLPNFVNPNMYGEIESDFINFVELHDLKQINLILNHIQRLLDHVLVNCNIRCERCTMPPVQEDLHHPCLLCSFIYRKQHLSRDATQPYPPA